ncbi:MAG: GWxTD domain-containing protein [Candidatus Aminicenantes bacterium]
MKKGLVFAVVFLTVFVSLSETQRRSRKAKIDIPERYQKWLDEEVVYIIAPLEKEVFLQLQTDRERDLFIEAFWRQRDPTPGNEENEARKEHYRRINYANHFYGRATPKPGWRTDRGRVYIILGEPNDVTRFEGKTQVYNTEVWFYQGMTKAGLPPGFNVLFYQAGGTGEYRLYSPLKDGPMALLTSYFGDQTDYLTAYRRLQEFEPELADFSLSLIPGEGVDITGRPNMTSDVLIQRIETTPVRMIKEKYAQKFLDFKDIVEVEYSTNWMDSDSLVKIIKDLSGIYFVHYAIEPERLSVNEFQEKFYTTLKLNGTVSDMDDKTIHQFEKDIGLEFDKEQVQQISRRPLSIRDMFPLIPGTYKVSILVKNEISKEFTSMERTLHIPSEEDSLQMTSLLMGYRTRENVPSQNRLRPFQMGRHQVYFQSNRVFVSADDLVLTFQVHGLTQGMKEKGEIRYTLWKDGEEFKTFSKPIADYAEVPNFVESISLDEFFPAHYRVQVSLWVDGREVLYEKDEFDVTHAESIARPWIYSKLLAPTEDPVYDYVLGLQLFNSGLTKEAKTSLEKAYNKKIDNLQFALSLARVYTELEEHTKVVPLLESFMSLPEPPPYEALLLLGGAYQKLGEFSKAIDVFDKAISRFGININVLNALGACYFRLGNTAEALAAWEKSLEIKPDQPDIRKNVKAIKEKR